VTVSPTEEAQGPPENGAPRRSPVGPVLALVLLGSLAAVQGAGILLRDRIEGRLPVASTPPPQAEIQGAQPSTAPPAGARFGPEVREVKVASVPSQAPSRPEVEAPPAEASPPGPAGSPEPRESSELPEAAVPAPPPPTAAAERLPEEPAPAARPAVEKPAPAASPAPAGPPPTHALQVGVFRSQKYRRQAELRLDELGVPHFRVEGVSRGWSFRVTVPASDPPARARAGEVLEGAGYLYRTSGPALEARFFLEEEARHALELLSRADLRGEVERVEGETPLWTVFAGPYSEGEARAVRQFLAQKGMESVLRRRP
jgi:hypothetical protein